MSAALWNNLEANVVEWHPVHRKKTGVVVRHIKVVVGARRVYRARIFGSQDPMTAVVYDDAQFEQRIVEVQKGSQVRHPHLAQFFGLGCSASMNTLIYHDEMIPFSQVQKLHAGSALASYYFRNETSRHFSAAYSYWQETTGDNLYILPGTAWIRLSTGKLCMDVGNGSIRWLHTAPITSILPHQSQELSRSLRFVTPVASGTVLISSQMNSVPFPLQRISHSMTYILARGTTCTRVIYLRRSCRLDGHDCPDRALYLVLPIRFNDFDAPQKWWLSQNHYVRNHLQGAFNATGLVTRIYFNCTLKTDLDFTLQGTFMTDAPTDKVYLFLFPVQVEVVDNLITVANPPDTEKYYWAFDPAGLDRLTHERAEDIGLPTVEFSIYLSQGKWDEHEYDMVRDFHIAKGYDPYTQDAAIAVGYPLIDIEQMKKFIPGFTDQSSMDCPDAAIDDGIYYSLGLC
ncbi:hypothetical protein B0H13DRAFT_773249 [Mycena leptocephala]|nr:hypothetical protein B0H13DRAFT_773249 [Mycena leptocephala]